MLGISALGALLLAAVLLALKRCVALEIPLVDDNISAVSSDTLVLSLRPDGAFFNPFSPALASDTLTTDNAFFTEIVTVDVSGGGSSVTPVLQSDGFSRMDVRGVACLNSTHCVAAAGNYGNPIADKYKSRGYALLTTDGGATWRMAGTCEANLILDDFMFSYATYHTEDVISVRGRIAVCYTSDGGATWKDVIITPLGPGYEIYITPSTGFVHVFRELGDSNGQQAIEVQFIPSTGVNLYNGSIALPSGALTVVGLQVLQNTYSGMHWLTYPGNGTQVGFLCLNNFAEMPQAMVTFDGGLSWVDTGLPGPDSTSAIEHFRVACTSVEDLPSSECYMYIKADDASVAGWYRATYNFTLWDQFELPIPAELASISWNYTTYDRTIMQCTQTDGVNSCMMLVYEYDLTVDVGRMGMIYSTDGWITSSYKPLWPVLGSAAGSGASYDRD
jgi:hypothetical protein